jgi:hypothetical protein
MFIFRNRFIFYGEGLLAKRPTPKPEDHLLSFAQDCLVNIFAATLHSWRPFLHPQTEDAPWSGDRDQPIMAIFNKKYYKHKKTQIPSASLSWCQASIWDTRPIFLLLSLIIFRQLRVCWCGAPSLTCGRTYNLLLLLVLSSAVPRDPKPYFIVPILEIPPTWRARPPLLYPPGTGWPRYIPGHWDLLLCFNGKSTSSPFHLGS